MLDTKNMLKRKITDKTATVGVIGLGYVGLPFAVEKGKVGYKVLGVEQRIVLNSRLLKLKKLAKNWGFFIKEYLKLLNMNTYIGVFHSVLKDGCYSCNEFSSFIEAYDIIG
ncbi:MAG: hypothetical protein H5T98_02690 [Syntrophomonadaceae bacterium]|nr:hypothetical protein [Syntrophomonadaceae bacterium]